MVRWSLLCCFFILTPTIRAFTIGEQKAKCLAWIMSCFPLFPHAAEVAAGWHRPACIRRGIPARRPQGRILHPPGKILAESLHQQPRTCRLPGPSIHIAVVNLPVNIAMRATPTNSWECATALEFEQKIYVKQHTADLLRHDLRRVKSG